MLDKGNVYILTADNILPDPDKTLSTVKMYILALSSIINGYQLLTNFLMWSQSKEIYFLSSPRVW
jgi:hypothetical protein